MDKECAEKEITDKTSDWSADLSVSPLTSHLSLLFPIVVLHLDNKDDDTTDESDKVGAQQVDIVDENALNDEGQAAYCHHDEARQRNAVGILGANGLNGLRQIAQNKANAGNPAAKVNEEFLIHSKNNI